MDNVIWAALIAMFSTAFTSPLLVVWYQKRGTDKVAAQLIQTNAAIADEAHKTRVETTARLDAIHTLVNSNLTAAQERELSMARALVISMGEVISLKEDRGIPIAKKTRDVIRELENRIEDMAADLAHKKQQTFLAENELKRRMEEK
jgi:hypothetical protein